MISIVVKDGLVLAGTQVIEYMSKLKVKDIFYIIPGLGDLTYLYKKEDIVSVYKAAGDALGCSVRQFTNMLNGAIYKAYIKPNIMLHSRFSIRGRGVMKYRTVKNVNECTNILKEYNLLGYNHVAAFGLLFKSEVTATVDLLGLPLWEKLCKNSTSRNDLIYKIVEDEFDITVYSKAIEFLNMLPTTVLRTFDKMYLRTMFTYGTEIDDGYHLIAKHISAHRGQYKTIDVSNLVYNYRKINTLINTGRFLGVDETRLTKLKYKYFNM